MTESAPPDEYEYGERIVPPMPERTFRFGEGRIAGASSLLLGALAFLGALA